jgi:MFS family permease
VFRILFAGPRYAAALLIDAVGGGLLRPFVLLYGVTVLGLSVAQAGLALTVGLLAGLAMLPLVGRWIDRGGRSAVVALTLLVRAAGVAVLIAGSGPTSFVIASVLMGVGGQAWPAAHAALVTATATPSVRDSALAAARSLRNAGLGAGALIATLAVRWPTALMIVTGASLLISGLLVLTLRVSAVPSERSGSAGGSLRGLTGLLVANLPLAFCFAVLEVVLPAVVETQLHVSPAWSAGMFVGNTVLVIVAQVPVVLWLSRWTRRAGFALSGIVLAVSYLAFWAASSSGVLAVSLVCVVYTIGEILYTGTGMPLVIASTPPHLLGRALVRWQLSSGLGMAAAPAVLTALFAWGPSVLWLVLAFFTLAGALSVIKAAPSEAASWQSAMGS